MKHTTVLTVSSKSLPFGELSLTERVRLIVREWATRKTLQHMGAATLLSHFTSVGGAFSLLVTHSLSDLSDLTCDDDWVPFNCELSSMSSAWTGWEKLMETLPGDALDASLGDLEGWRSLGTRLMAGWEQDTGLLEKLRMVQCVGKWHDCHTCIVLLKLLKIMQQNKFPCP